MRPSWLALAFVAALAVPVLGIACSNGANGVDACRQIEDARCVRAASCGIDLAFPLHAGSSPSDDVTACQLFYEDACLHGLTTSVSPSNIEVTQCVAAIAKTGSCDAVVNPQNNPSCAWLNPPDAGVDAGTASDATSTTADVTVVVTVDASTTVTSDASDAPVSSCNTTCESQCVGDPICINACGC
jgi:hypothetical protein